MHLIPRYLNRYRVIFSFFALALILNPFFFTIYRLAVFNTVPRDDYAPYLLWLSGAPGGSVAEAPYVYRIGAILLAWPFYQGLPSLPLTNIPAGLSVEWVRATAAFAALSYTCMIASMIVVYRLSRDVSVGIASAFFMFIVFWFTQITAIDALGLFLIVATYALLERPVWFFIVIFASLFIDEKVVIVFVIWLSARLVFLPRSGIHPWNWAISVMGLLFYLGTVHLLHFAGNEYQTTMSSYPQTILENLQTFLTAKGIVLNAIPVLLLFCLASMAVLARTSSPADLLVIPGLLLTALTLTHLLQAGRIVMHAAPIFAVPVATTTLQLLQGFRSSIKRSA